jgi:hypothetical protein
MMGHMMAASSFYVDRNRSSVGSANYLDIYYQNVRGLRTKYIDIFNNLCSFDYKIICLIETYLNESHSSQNSF